MSASDRVEQTPAEGSRQSSRIKYAAAYFALLTREPRRRLSSPTPLQWTAGLLAIIASLTGTMLFIDAPSVGIVQSLPEWLIASFDRITDFGRSSWFLVPIAVVLALMGVFVSPALPATSRRVLAAVAVRLGFLFSAIALPGLVVTIGKRLVGRGRPLVAGSADPFLYLPFGWNVEYASFPSGHATDAFAAAMAVGALWPAARAWMWIYAGLIAASRVVLTAHFPSDVLAGAIFAVAVVLLVRAWFARRGLLFARGEDGRIRPMPGPSHDRLKRVARQLIAP